MTAIANLPDIRPSLLLDFANSGRVDPRIQCTRASSATCFGPDGKLRTVAVNTPRIDYDPVTGKCLGLRTEGEARTNLLSNSTDLLAWSKGADTTVTAVAGGAPNGATSFAVNNAGSSSHVSASYPATSGNTYAVSVYWRGTSKPATGFLISAEYRNGDASLRVLLSFASTEIIADGLWRRYSVAATDAGNSSGGRAVFFCTGTGTADSGEIAMPQAEAGSFASSYIPTSGAAATRPAEIFAIDVPALVGQAAGTVLVEFSVNALKSSGINEIVRLRDGSPNTYFLALREGGVISGCDVVAYAAGAIIVDTDSRALAANTLHKAAIGYATNDTGFSLNGQAVLNHGTPTFPLAQPFSRLMFGAHMGHVQRVAIYNRRLTDVQMQRITR